jgi:hypothetical protein
LVLRLPERLPKLRLVPYIIPLETEPVIEDPLMILTALTPENEPINNVAATVPETTALPTTPSSPVCEEYVLQVVIVPVRLDVLPVESDPTIAQFDRAVPVTTLLPVTLRSPV